MISLFVDTGISVWLLVAVVFLVTSLWDNLLRFSVRYFGWFPVMKPYFDAHGAFYASFAAGITGAITTALILVLATAGCGGAGLVPQLSVPFLAWTALFSAAVGLVMRYTQVFPPLGTTYYAQPVATTFALDGLSGVMVMVPAIAITGNYQRTQLCQ